MKKQQGFTLVEIFISLMVGLVLLAGVLSVFVGLKTTASETSSFGSMQETGRFAISVLTEDLMRQGFWGDMINPLTHSHLLTDAPAAPTGECIGGGLNNGSFPLQQGHFRSLWGMSATTENALDCIDNAKIGSDILQVKRTISAPHTAGLVAGNYYLISNMVTGAIFVGTQAPPPIDNSRIWEYQHHIYYISEDTFNQTSIPSLNIITLASTLNDQPLIDGVEMIRFMYGIDSDLDGVVNGFISADNMTEAMWDNTGTARILAVKMYVLVRDILPDRKYNNTTVYSLGDITFRAQNDNYRRMVFSSTVSLHNGDVEVWQ